MELLDHSPLKGEKLKFVVRVMGLSHGQTPAGIGADGIDPVITSLVQFKKPSKIRHRQEWVLWCTDASVL